MSDDDLIRRGDALSAILTLLRWPTMHSGLVSVDDVSAAIAALPAVAVVPIADLLEAKVALHQAQELLAALEPVAVGVIHEEQNTEQRKAFWNWLPLAYRDGHLGEEAKFTKYNMEVAHYAGWCAALEPVALTSNFVDDSQKPDPAVNPAAIREAAAVVEREIEQAKKMLPMVVPILRGVHKDILALIQKGDTNV